MAIWADFCSNRRERLGVDVSERLLCIELTILYHCQLFPLVGEQYQKNVIQLCAIHVLSCISYTVRLDVWLRLTLGIQDQPHNQSVQTQDLSKDKYQDHTHEYP